MSNQKPVQRKPVKKKKVNIRKRWPIKKIPACGEYRSHKWNYPVGSGINEETLSRVCARCGITFREVYDNRKKILVERYRAEINAR